MFVFCCLLHKVKCLNFLVLPEGDKTFAGRLWSDVIFDIIKRNICL